VAGCTVIESPRIFSFRSQISRSDKLIRYRICPRSRNPTCRSITCSKTAILGWRVRSQLTTLLLSLPPKHLYEKQALHLLLLLLLLHHLLLLFLLFLLLLLVLLLHLQPLHPTIHSLLSPFLLPPLLPFCAITPCSLPQRLTNLSRHYFANLTTSLMQRFPPSPPSTCGRTG